jgi:hypothetical protein
MMAASSTSGGGKRILAHLEHGARPAAKPARASGWAIDGWTVGLGVLLLLMCGIAWMMHEKKITPSTFKYSESRSRQTAETPRVEIAVMAAAGQSAAIVNEPTSAASASLIGVTNQATLDVQRLPAHAAQPHGAQPHGAQPEQANSSAATRTPQAPAAVKAAPARNAAGEATGSPAAPDTDVALLTALVAHANKPTVTVAERSRDVVERQHSDSTAELLARCQQLGLIEGMLCRSRICSGRWDADAACRAPAH